MIDNNNPPPRRGFTQSMAGERSLASPVVVGINHSPMSSMVLRKAANEAAHRSLHLHVVVNGSPDQSLEGAVVDDREVHIISAILRNQHVTVIPIEDADPEALLDYCKKVGASLLVVGCDARAVPGDLESPETAHCLVDGAESDVLVVQTGERHEGL